MLRIGVGVLEPPVSAAAARAGVNLVVVQHQHPRRRRRVGEAAAQGAHGYRDQVLLFFQQFFETGFLALALAQKHDLVIRLPVAPQILFQRFQMPLIPPSADAGKMDAILRSSAQRPVQDPAQPGQPLQNRLRMPGYGIRRKRLRLSAPLLLAPGRHLHPRPRVRRGRVDGDGVVHHDVTFRNVVQETGPVSVQNTQVMLQSVKCALALHQFTQAFQVYPKPLFRFVHVLREHVVQRLYQDGLAAWQHPHRLVRVHRPLRTQIECPNGFHLIAEKLDPDRMCAAKRAHVQDSAPHAELPHSAHQRHTLVADIHQMFSQRVRRHLFPDPYFTNRQIIQIRRQRVAHQGLHRNDHDPVLCPLQLIQRLQPKSHHVEMGRPMVVWRSTPGGENPDPARTQHALQIVAHFFRSIFGSAYHQHRTRRLLLHPRDAERRERTRQPAYWNRRRAGLDQARKILKRLRLDHPVVYPPDRHSNPRTCPVPTDATRAHDKEASGEKQKSRSPIRRDRPQHQKARPWVESGISNTNTKNHPYRIG